MIRSDGFSIPARAALIQVKSSLTNPRPMSGQYTARTNVDHANINPISRTPPTGGRPATAAARDFVGATTRHVSRSERSSPRRVTLPAAGSLDDVNARSPRFVTAFKEEER